VNTISGWYEEATWFGPVTFDGQRLALEPSLVVAIKLSPRPGSAGYLVGFKTLRNAFESYLLAMGFKQKVRVRHDPDATYSDGYGRTTTSPRTTTKFLGWTCGCIDRQHPCDRHAMAVRDYKPKVIYVRELDRRRGAGRRKGDQKKSRKAA
jgi:hypothetical protein